MRHLIVGASAAGTAAAAEIRRRDPEAGIVNDAAGVPDITREVVVAANEEGGETNISTGWHAIEFLLWGQDLSESGPGSRRGGCCR